MPEQPIRNLVIEILTYHPDPQYVPDLLQIAKLNLGKGYGKGHDGSYDLPSAKQFREVLDKMASEGIVEIRGFKVILPKEEEDKLQV